jgi:hypothetical protein
MPPGVLPRELDGGRVEQASGNRRVDRAAAEVREAAIDVRPRILDRTKDVLANSFGGSVGGCHDAVDGGRRKTAAKRLTWNRRFCHPATCGPLSSDSPSAPFKLRNEKHLVLGSAILGQDGMLHVVGRNQPDVRAFVLSKTNGRVGGAPFVMATLPLAEWAPGWGRRAEILMVLAADPMTVQGDPAAGGFIRFCHHSIRRERFAYPAKCRVETVAESAALRQTAFLKPLVL